MPLPIPRRVHGLQEKFYKYHNMDYLPIYDDLLKALKKRYPNRIGGSYIGSARHYNRYIQIHTPLKDGEVHYEYIGGHVELHFEGNSLIKYWALLDHLERETENDDRLVWFDWGDVRRCQLAVVIHSYDELYGNLDKMMGIFDIMFKDATGESDPDAWDDANDPCPEGWRVPTTWEIIQTLGFSDDHCKTKDKFNCIRIEAGERGFTKSGLIVGWGQNVPDRITKENIVKEGGMFIPVSGWISDGGYTDRTWLYTLWGATSHKDNLAGLYLTSYNDYCDHWGWGDGHKNYATVVRCIKK